MAAQRAPSRVSPDRRRERIVKRIGVVLALVTSGGVLLGRGGRAATSLAPEATATQSPSAGSSAPARGGPAATISDRHGPSRSGRLGDTVHVDWCDQQSGTTRSERIAVLAVKHLPNPKDDHGPDEFGDEVGPYNWKCGTNVRLTTLDSGTARTPVACQFLMPIGARQARWALDWPRHLIPAAHFSFSLAAVSPRVIAGPTTLELPPPGRRRSSHESPETWQSDRALSGMQMP